AGADEADASTGEPTLIEQAEELVDDINDRAELDEPLAALGLDESLEPVLGDPPPAAAPDAIGSFEFLWWDSSGFEIAVTVDVSTGDYRALAVDGTQVLRADGTYFGRSDNADWTELDGDAPAIEVVGTDGLMAVESVVPAALDPYVLQRETLADGQDRVVIDDIALAATDSELRTAWLGPWGLIGDATDVVELIVATNANGTVTEVVISSSAIGGEAGYRLDSTSPRPLVVDVPTS
ncbi:MAG: hypothetical protein ACR2O6_04965, partial [Ilumatobacteraceae bacterium]